MKKEANKSDLDTNFLDCKKCGSGKVETSTKLKKDCVEVNIKKCNICGYQYGLKELFLDNNIPFNFNEK